MLERGMFWRRKTRLLGTVFSELGVKGTAPRRSSMDEAPEVLYCVRDYHLRAQCSSAGAGVLLDPPPRAPLPPTLMYSTSKVSGSWPRLVPLYLSGIHGLVLQASGPVVRLEAAPYANLQSNTLQASDFW